MENLNDINLNGLLSGLGITTRNESTAELLENFGLNWKVEKMPLSLPDGTPSGFFGIVREDNKKTFTTCKDGYVPFQNSELLELVNEASGRLGLKVNNGGSFADGGRVYLQIETGNVTGMGQNNDTIKKQVTAINSHNGSTALRWGLSNITISCANTFWAAYREVKNSVRHTATMHFRVEQMMRQIEGAAAEEKTLYETFFKFAAVQATPANIKQAVKLVLDVDLNTAKASDLTTYQNNRLNELSGAINHQMKEKGSTLWGIFSGVTKYTTHIMPGGNENRKQSKAVGMGYSLDNSVFQQFAEIVK